MPVLHGWLTDECHCHQRVPLLDPAYSHRDVPLSLLQPPVPRRPWRRPVPVRVSVSVSASAPVSVWVLAASVKPGGEHSLSPALTTGMPCSCRERRSRCFVDRPTRTALTREYAPSHAGPSLFLSTSVSVRHCRVRGKIIRCSIVCNSCAQCSAHACEQT